MTSRDFDCPTLSPTEDLWVGMQLPRTTPKFSAFRTFVCTIGDEILTQEIILNTTSLKMPTPFNCPSRINWLIKSLPFPPSMLHRARDPISVKLLKLSEADS